MRDFVISFLIPFVLLVVPPAHAGDPGAGAESVDVSTATKMVQSCLEQAAHGEANETSCIGVSVSPCSADALTTVEMLSCLAPEASVWETRMSAALETLGAAYSEQDTFEEPARALAPRLRIYQDQWLIWRDAKCGFEHDKFRGGSLGRIASADCRLETTARRSLELEELAEEAAF